MITFTIILTCLLFIVYPFELNYLLKLDFKSFQNSIYSKPSVNSSLICILRRVVQYSIRQNLILNIQPWNLTYLTEVHELKWIEINQNETKWIKMNQNEMKWIELNGGFRQILAELQREFQSFGLRTEHSREIEPPGAIGIRPPPRADNSGSLIVGRGVSRGCEQRVVVFTRPSREFTKIGNSCRY